MQPLKKTKVRGMWQYVKCKKMACNHKIMQNKERKNLTDDYSYTSKYYAIWDLNK